MQISHQQNFNMINVICCKECFDFYVIAIPWKNKISTVGQPAAPWSLYNPQPWICEWDLCIRRNITSVIMLFHLAEVLPPCPQVYLRFIIYWLWVNQKEIILGGPDLKKWAPERDQRDWKGETPAGLEAAHWCVVQRAMSIRHEGGLWELIRAPGWQPGRKWKSHSYNYKEFNSVNQRWARKRILSFG